MIVTRTLPVPGIRMLVLALPTAAHLDVVRGSHHLDQPGARPVRGWLPVQSRTGDRRRHRGGLTVARIVARIGGDQS